MKNKIKAVALSLITLAAFALFAVSAAEPVRYGRDVLPILAANCFACHGPDQQNRKAGLRLDAKPTPKPNAAPDSPSRRANPTKA